MCFAGIEEDVRALEARRRAALEKDAQEAEPHTFRLPQPEGDKTVRIERPLREPQAA